MEQKAVHRRPGDRGPLDRRPMDRGSADRRPVDRKAVRRLVELKACPEQLAMALRGDETESLARLADGDESQPACTCYLGDTLASFAVDIDDGRRARRKQLAEQAQLLLEIIFDARMII